MDFFTNIGNGNGVFMMFNQQQLDGTEYYTTEVIAQSTAFIGEANANSAFANASGVFENTVEAKADFYEKIRKFILPTESGYEFVVRFFLNPNLTEAQAAAAIAAGNIQTLVDSAETTEITVANDSNGFLAKLIG